MKKDIAVSTIAMTKDLNQQKAILDAHEKLHNSIIKSGDDIPSVVAFRESTPKLDDATIQGLESMWSSVCLLKNKETFANQLITAFKEWDKLADIVLYAEWDKKDYFEKWFLKTIKFIKSNPWLDVYIVERSKKNNKTFPKWQQYREWVFNEYAKSKWWKLKDYQYWPRAIKDVSRFLWGISEHPDLWRWVLNYILWRAMSQGAKIIWADWAVDCPKDQRTEKIDEYRKDQYLQTKKWFDLWLGE